MAQDQLRDIWERLNEISETGTSSRTLLEEMKRDLREMRLVLHGDGERLVGVVARLSQVESWQSRANWAGGFALRYLMPLLLVLLGLGVAAWVQHLK